MCALWCIHFHLIHSSNFILSAGSIPLSYETSEKAHSFHGIRATILNCLLSATYTIRKRNRDPREILFLVFLSIDETRGLLHLLHHPPSPFQVLFFMRLVAEERTRTDGKKSHIPLFEGMFLMSYFSRAKKAF